MLKFKIETVCPSCEDGWVNPADQQCSGPAWEWWIGSTDQQSTAGPAYEEWWRRSDIFLAKAFKAEEGDALAAEIHAAVNNGDFGFRRVVIVDHPPTAGLVPLIEGLAARHEDGIKAVYLRDHHADGDRDGSTVARCRELLGDRAVISTRAVDPACASLVQVGEFAGDIIVADADQDGVTAALKAAGVVYDGLDADAAVLDGPHTGKTAEALSPLGFAFVRAWGAIPTFGDRNRAAVFTQVVEAFVSAARGEQAGNETLARLAVEYERKVAGAKALAATATMLSPQVRFVDATSVGDFDPPTLAAEMDRGGVAVSGRLVKTGPIAKAFGAQVSLARTKAGEKAVDLAALVPADWARGPEAGCISNTPFLLHLSPARWEEFRPILLAKLGE